MSPTVGRAQSKRVPYQTFTVTRGTSAAAGKSHLGGIGCAAGQYDMAMSVGGTRKEVTNVTVIHA